MAALSIGWAELGFSDGEVGELASCRRSARDLSLAEELAVWRQWVVELERGEFLTAKEFAERV
jgi:hypothetical protein